MDEPASPATTNGHGVLSEGTGVPPEPAPVPLDDPSLYANRELSWLDFNDRVLQLAEDQDTPLMERVKFLAIFSNNLDEYFMVRVAGLWEQIAADMHERSADGLTPRQTLAGIRTRVEALVARQTACFKEIRGLLEEHEVRLVGYHELDEEVRTQLADRFRNQIWPVLTPLAIGVGRPFPYISNLALSLAVLVRDPVTKQETFARVKVPKGELIDRFIEAGSPTQLLPLEELIAEHLGSLFTGMEIVDHSFFRVTRDADYTVSDEADDLMRAVERELRRRRFGEIVRVEVHSGIGERLRKELVSALGIDEQQVYDFDGVLDHHDLWQVVGLDGFKELRDEPFSPVVQPRLMGANKDDDDDGDIFAAMREGDILVHHPYDSFNESVVRFVEQAVVDPNVLAIKQTVYRTSSDTPLVPALIRATERGKQAVCLVELKARFDEAANIQWARRLEQAGVHVVYGHPSLKTHAKCVLVVRREGDGVRHYVHVGTGNYHPKTARLYTDFGLFTTDEAIGRDVADMYNFLTGFSRPRKSRKALVAPSAMRDGIIRQIDLTIDAHERGESSRIRMKMNSLVDRQCIEALYRASQAGVPIDLNVRGICCLRPGVPGVSDEISVVSIVGRFLEHSRIYAFERGDERSMWIGSADLMPRNLDTRVELLVPVEDATAQADLLDTLDRCFADDTNAWELHEDGTWQRRHPTGPEPRNAQRELMIGHLAREAEAASSSG